MDKNYLKYIIMILHSTSNITQLIYDVDTHYSMFAIENDVHKLSLFVYRNTQKNLITLLLAGSD